MGKSDLFDDEVKVLAEEERRTYKEQVKKKDRQKNIFFYKRQPTSVPSNWA